MYISIFDLIPEIIVVEIIQYSSYYQQSLCSIQQDA
jgi:hypothetical protein